MSDPKKDQKPNEGQAPKEDPKKDSKPSAPKKTVKQMAKLTAVRFVKPHAPYIVGDVAGFNTKEAKKLVDGGIAKAIK